MRTPYMLCNSKKKCRLKLQQPSLEALLLDQHPPGGAHVGSMVGEM